MTDAGGAPPLLWVGSVVLAVGAAYVLAARDDRRRRVAIAVVLALAPALVLVDAWDTERIADLRDRPALAVAGGAALLFAAMAVAIGCRRRPTLLALLIVAVLPFRIPIELAGTDANLLLPLYLLIAAGGGGAVAGLLAQPSAPVARDSRRVALALGAAVVLYAIQAAYSSDFSAALNNLAFFFAPFAVAFVLLRGIGSAAAVRIALAVLIIEALVFAALGGVQLVTGELFWNEKVIEGNEAHSWFRVNSLFFDPNIYGRYLAVAMLGLAAIVAHLPAPRTKLLAAALFTVLLGGLAISYSQSSLIALLVGLAVLSMTRWRSRGAAIVGTLALGAVVLGIIAGGPGSGVELRAGESLDTGGRGDLVRTGLEIAADRPLAGFGSGSFEVEFRDRAGGGPEEAVASHTEPVTVAAEQGLVGLGLYGAVVGLAAVMLARPLQRSASRDPASGWAERSPLQAATRAGLLATFAAMVVHSLVYAAFLSDPITWTILAFGAVLARED